MNNWKKYKLGDLVTFQRGHDLPQTQFNGGKYPIWGSNGIIGYHDEFTTKGNGIVIGRSGNIGKPQFCEEDFWAHNTTLYVKEFHNSNPKFMFYLLHTINLANYNSGSAVPTLNRNYIHPIEIEAPNLETQTHIANFLSQFDDKIELNRQMNKNLEELAELKFKTLLKDKDKWRKGKLGELLDVSGGGTPSTKVNEFWNGEFNWCTPKDLSKLTFPVLLDTDRKITELGVKEISSGVLPKGTLLLSSRAPIGYLAICEIPTAINQGFIAINSKCQISNIFMLIWLKVNMHIVLSMSGGTTFQEINKSNFRKIEIEIPNNETLIEFDNYAKPIFEKIIFNEMQSRTLATYRDSILPKLMSGAIEI